MAAEAGSAPPFEHPSPGVVELGSRVKKGMEGTAHAYEGKTEKVTPVDVGRSARSRSRSREPDEVRGYKPVRSVSGFLPTDERRMEAAEKSNEFRASMAELEYEFEEAVEMRREFIEEVDDSKPEKSY